MAKYKGSAQRRQAKHNKKSKKSQHDKRQRLQSRNPKRKRTTKAKVPLTGTMQKAVSVLRAVMDRRIAFRLAIVVAGMLLADDRRTASKEGDLTSQATSPHTCSYLCVPKGQSFVDPRPDTTAPVTVQQTDFSPSGKYARRSVSTGRHADR